MVIWTEVVLCELILATVLQISYLLFGFVVVIWLVGVFVCLVRWLVLSQSFSV